MLSSCHVYRIRPQSELAPRHPAARELRENGKVRKRTLCNLSDWPAAHIEGLRGVLKGGIVIAPDREPSPSPAPCRMAMPPWSSARTKNRPRQHDRTRRRPSPRPRLWP